MFDGAPWASHIGIFVEHRPRHSPVAWPPLRPQNPGPRGNSRGQDMPGIARFPLRVAASRLADPERPTIGMCVKRDGRMSPLAQALIALAISG